MLHSHYETAFYKMKRISIHGNVVNTPFGCHTEHIRAGKRLTLKINLNRHCYVASQQDYSKILCPFSQCTFTEQQLIQGLQGILILHIKVN